MLGSLLLGQSKIDPLKFTEFLNKNARAGWEVVTMEKDEPIVKTAAGAYKEITKKEPVYNGVPGATDGTFLRAWKGIPSLVNGPGPRHMPHQYDEYVETDELYESALIYALTEYRFLK